MPWQKTFLKEMCVRKTEWWSPESCPAAHVPFLSPWFMPQLPILSAAPESPLSSPCFPICLQSGSRGQVQIIFTHLGILQAPQTQNNLHGTHLASCPHCFYLAPVTAQLHGTLWPLPASCTPHLCQTPDRLTSLPQALLSFSPSLPRLTNSRGSHLLWDKLLIF